jgi:NADH:ubiquinone oxidoreductase subunit 5 (subunit L)/multisubunit Na+/H+ antiporter MnhA subunit
LNCLFILVLLVPLLPLLAAAGVAVTILTGAAGDAAEPPTARLAEGAAWGALLILLGLASLAFVEGAPGHFTLGTWFAAGEFVAPISFIVDPLSLGFGAIVAATGVVALRFARHYLHREAGFHRFFLLMALFLAGMLTIVLSGNTVLTFVGWELCGVSSFLLIGYAWERPTATGNGLYAFVTNRIGDAGFILGIALAAGWLGTVEWSGLAHWAGGNGASPFDAVTARLILIGFIVAALAKSAQLPFSAWIARALEGPTPSSAIFYGALMVHAGVYLVLRLEPVLMQLPDVRMLLALVGALTALYGWLAGLTQSDAKSSLLFATTTQVGLMFLACGLGWFDFAAGHMALHAVWRAWQFLLAPSLLHVTLDSAGAPRWLVHRQWLYTAALRRFWLEPALRGLLIRPTLAVGQDMRALDDKLLSHLVGMPAHAAAETRGDDVIRAHGLPGRLLLLCSDWFQKLERFLVFERVEGPFARALQRVGGYLNVFELLLERPRYMVLAILATFVVIL